MQARFFTAAPAIVCLAYAVAFAPARAQECSTTCSMYVEGECTEYTHTCTSPSEPVFSFGAIAYGRGSSAYGYSYHWGNRGKAESVALSNCAQHGNDCEVMVWFDRKCGAVATATDGGHASWGLGDGEGAARGQALSRCTKDGGGKCVVKVSQCSR